MEENSRIEWVCSTIDVAEGVRVTGRPTDLVKMGVAARDNLWKKGSVLKVSFMEGGDELLNPPGRPPKVVACLHATAPSSTAYQTSNEEFSFFGKAFIEGVQRAGGQGNVRRPGFLDVEFIDLVRYVKPRVMKLLQAHSETLEQTARGAIEPCDASLVVTQLPVPVGTS